MYGKGTELVKGMHEGKSGLTIYDHYPEQSAKDRAEAITRFIAMSGPEYVDVPLLVIQHAEDFTVVDWQDGEVPDAIFQRQVSYASWHMLRAAQEGEIVTVKIRSDDVGLKL